MDSNSECYNYFMSGINKFETSHTKLETTINKFMKRIDDYETELAARDHKIERLERWIEKIAAKTGVDLH